MSWKAFNRYSSNIPYETTCGTYYITRAQRLKRADKKVLEAFCKFKGIPGDGLNVILMADMREFHTVMFAARKWFAMNSPSRVGGNVLELVRPKKGKRHDYQRRRLAA